MACSSCGSRRQIAKPAAEKATVAVTSDFTLVTTSLSRVRSGAGQMYSIFVPLVKFRPPTGWGLGVKIKGHDHYVEGQTAKEVVTKIIQLHKDNGIDIAERNVWFNANLLWLNTVSEKHAYARKSDLAALADR